MRPDWSDERFKRLREAHAARVAARVALCLAVSLMALMAAAQLFLAR